MGLGSTAKKLQLISEHAEKMYKQVQELQQRIFHLEEEVDDTHDTVKKLDREIEQQRALLIAMSEKLMLDPDEILAEAAVDDAATVIEDVDAPADGDESEGGESASTDGAKTADGSEPQHADANGQ
ncbi:DUF5798 family protein [Natronobiforma cellulositropha]|uniref:DUF5798 family protein n=1 Tax=Natronobiforma cellulositropha TaxID=1679076 RepID=UPI0021D5ABC0|nr:DUF5798 family protein [Natronobiforma cellulositropha]